MAENTTATEGKRERRTPQLVEAIDGDIPTMSRGGFWSTEAERIRQEPGKVFVYKDVSPTAASYLRKNFGFDAATRTVDKQTVLYVKFDPSRVEAIKQEVKDRAAARAATAAKNKANGGAKAGAAKGK